MFIQGHFVNAEIRIKDDVPINDALAAIHQFCLDMNSEAGCSFAMALQDKQDPRRIILWERYEDEAASQRHFDEPHTQRFIQSGSLSLSRRRCASYRNRSLPHDHDQTT